MAHEVYFPSQLELNDPFDCLPIWEKGVTFELFRKYIHPVICAVRTEMAREVHPFAFHTAEMAEIVHRNIKSESFSVIKNLYNKRFDRIVADMFATVGILSLTKCRDNIVMWSMYANRSNGICIELDNLIFKSKGRVFRPVQVQYMPQRPRLTYFGATALVLQMTSLAAQYIDRDTFDHMLDSLDQIRYAWTKHERWRYEEEYRLIAYKSGGRYVPIGPGRVSALYLGNNISRSTRDQIIALAIRSERRVAVYEGTMSDRGYTVEFQRID